MILQNQISIQYHIYVISYLNNIFNIIYTKNIILKERITIMFQTRNTGKKISQLRKERNITQMELADLMGVSYQAVSNWERGNSMPDISKLPELAEILGISIDDLLNDGKPLELVKNIINGTENEYISEEKISIDTVAEVAPLLKPMQTEKIVDKVIEETKGSFDFEDIIQIAPFLSEEKVDMLALNLSSNNMMSQLVALAPFMSRDALDNLALKSSSNGKLSELIGLAPFLSKNTLDTLARNSFSSESLSELVMFAPFLSKDTLDELALKSSDKSDKKTLIALAPFLSKNTLDTLAKDSFTNENLNELIMFAPFLSKDTLNDLALKSSNKNDKNTLMALAPFLGRETLNKIVDDYVKDFGIKDLKNIIPFL